MVSPTEDKGNGSSSLSKPQTADENKRPDTLLARFERRDNLKKANTLPSSVTGKKKQNRSNVFDYISPKKLYTGVIFGNFRPYAQLLCRFLIIYLLHTHPPS